MVCNGSLMARVEFLNSRIFYSILRMPHSVAHAEFFKSILRHRTASSSIVCALHCWYTKTWPAWSDPWREKMLTRSSVQKVGWKEVLKITLSSFLKMAVMSTKLENSEKTQNRLKCVKSNLNVSLLCCKGIYNLDLVKWYEM